MTSLLRISEAASLALHTMYYLAINEDGENINTKILAEDLGVSEAHLRKVVHRLVKAGYINSCRGPRGGIKINGDKKDIALIDIYEAIEGPMDFNGCLLPNRFCGPGECMFRNLIDTVNNHIVETLSGSNLQELAERQKQVRQTNTLK